ncbi:MAG: MBOAT family O-acyltransferase, partial [Bryobacteraceae bacterium]
AGRPLLAAAALALPLGISFYSFEAISYLMDVRQGRVGKTSFTDLCLFVVFWPHLIAGPIVRVRELIPQFQFQKKFELARLTGGLDRLLWGLVQKNVVANSLGSWVDEGFIAKTAKLNSTVDNWFLAVAFGLQIYFDFNAYSNMAIGTAQILGVKLPENFRMPYLAANPADFWARWHMTLSRWIRDYLFFPISTRFSERPIALYASLIGVMALVGLWHGAGWGFILWGTMHGVFLVLYRALEGKLGASKLVALAWRAFTLAAVAAAWIPFRAATVDQAVTMLRTMFLGFRFEISYSINFYLLTLLVMLFCALEPFFGRLWTRIETAAANSPAANHYAVRPLVYASALLLFVIFDDLDTKFIYFQF